LPSQITKIKLNTQNKNGYTKGNERAKEEETQRLQDQTTIQLHSKE
jgi:hypothetical protein